MKNREFAAAVTEALIRKFLVEWQLFYKKHRERLCLEERDFDFLNEGIHIPEPKEGFDRLIVVARGLTLEKILSAVKSLTPVWWKYRDNLNEITSDRKADKDYCVWVRNRVEADEELANKSASDLTRENIHGITLEERFLYGLKFLDETGKHIDIENWTLCSGSRFLSGDVPSVYWDRVTRRVEVRWDFFEAGDNALRSRAVVS